MGRSSKRPRRRRAEDSRQALLDTGRAMAHDRPAGSPLEHIRLTEVARRAGVSVGALYHYWDTQDDYREDLLDHVLAPDRFEPESAAVDSLLPLDELIRQGTDVEFAHLRSSPDLRVLLTMWAADDADINPRISRHYRAANRDWAAFYEATFAAFGLEVRPPFTYENIAALLAAVGDGLAVRASTDPAAVPDQLVEPTAEGERVWTLLGCALIALLPAFSRPVGSDETFWDELVRQRAERGV